MPAAPASSARFLHRVRPIGTTGDSKTADTDSRRLPLVLRRGLFDTGGVVALRTWTFAITLIQSNTAVAQALICPDARYVAVRWQDGRLDRRHVSPLLWPALEQELAHDLSAEPVSRSSMISTVLVGSMGALMVVSFVETQPVTVGRMEDAEKVLDAATRFVQPV